MNVSGILLEARADPRLVGEDGNTAITVARRNGHRGTANTLEEFQHLQAVDNRITS